jgi:hypothetical protein
LVNSWDNLAYLTMSSPNEVHDKKLNT